MTRRDDHGREGPTRGSEAIRIYLERHGHPMALTSIQQSTSAADDQA